jgi:hypothetical protein
MTSSHVVNALGDGDWAVVTVSHCIDGRDIVEGHWGWSVPRKWKETGLVRVGMSDSRAIGLSHHTGMSSEYHWQSKI